MSDLSNSIDALSERLENAADAVEGMADTVVEEAQDQSWMTWVLWGSLVAMTGWGLWNGSWRTAFVTFLTLLVSLAPLVIQRWADFKLPRMLMFFIVLFAVCTLVLGEVFDFFHWNGAAEGTTHQGDLRGGMQGLHDAAPTQSQPCRHA